MFFSEEKKVLIVTELVVAGLGVFVYLFLCFGAHFLRIVTLFYPEET